MDEEIFDEFGNVIGSKAGLEYTLKPTDTVDTKGSLDIQKEDDDEENDLSHNHMQLINYNIDVANENTKTNMEEVNILVETENTQPLNQPLIAPKRSKFHSKQYKNSIRSTVKALPPVTYDVKYLVNMSAIPERIRNVAIIGPRNSGKTSLVDLIVMDTHRMNLLAGVTDSVIQGWKQLKFMDLLKQEHERRMSIKLNGITFLASDLDDKSTVINLLDTPGHVNFMEEVSIAINACENVIICIDVVEGVTASAEQLIKQSIKYKKKILFVLNKFDRLILELKLTPEDAYLKLLYTVASLNQYIEYLNRKFETSLGPFSPELNNIIFASSKLGFTFTLEEFVERHYKDQVSLKNTRGKFVNLLWNKNQFIEFVLYPIYKVITSTLTYEDPIKLIQQLIKSRVLAKGTKIPSHLQDPQPILRFVLRRFFGENQLGLYSSIEKLLDSPYVAPLKSQEMIGHILKFMDYYDDEYCLVKIYAGNITVGSKFNVLNDDEEEIDEPSETQEKGKFQSKLGYLVEKIILMDGQYSMPVDIAYQGQLVLIKSQLKDEIIKCGTIYTCSMNDIPESMRLRELDYINKSYFKVSIAPLQPRELPKLVNALDKVNKHYPGVIIRVEDSGEHVILGTGELYMDCLLYDLREVYGQMEIKVSTPMTVFHESCDGESFAAIPVETMDSKFKLSVGATKMDLRLVKDLLNGDLPLNQDLKQLARILRDKYGWDSLTSRNVWLFSGTNVLIDDTLPDETDKDLLSDCKDILKQGFFWALNEGPLCGEPIHGIQFKILEFGKLDSSDNSTAININQLIPAIRKACYIAIMTATPNLLEPIYEVNIMTKTVYMEVVNQLFQKRRGGQIINSKPIVGSPFIEIRGHLPIIESVGFEVDLRLVTQGQSTCQLQYINQIWKRVPGDVMNEDAVIPKLKPATRDAIARDFVMKGRRRRGEQHGPSLANYVDAGLYEELKEAGLV